MPIHPDTPQSLDPLVTGTGHPLEEGDIVRHVRDAVDPTRTALVAEVDSAGRIRVMPGPGSTSGTFEAARIGQWPTHEFQLVRRHSSPAPAASGSGLLSLDPNVPGTGQPFQLNDILRHRLDPQTPEYDFQVSKLFSDHGSEGKIGVTGWGNANRRIGLSFWPSKDLILVKRPGPTDYAYLPPAPLRAGMSGEMVNMDFVSAIAGYLYNVAHETRYDRTTNNFAHPTGAGGGPLTWNEAKTAVLRFVQGVSYEVERPTSWYPITDASPDFVSTASLVAITLQVGQLVHVVLNHFDPETPRCGPCAKSGIFRAPGPSCTHFTCSRCCRAQTERCTTCTEYVLGLPGVDSGQVCARCCSHFTCTCGCGSTVLTEGCKRCMRSAKHCECPACEDASCERSAALPCCGHCTGHCECRSHCMKTTGMLELEKFYAPHEEQGLTRLLGTEIEVAGATNFYSPLLRKAVKQWLASVILDGSVHARGVELVTQPAGGSNWIKMIADFGAGFEESKSYTSAECGLHVHVDAGDLGILDLHRLIRLYNHLEFTLYDALPFSRQLGRYAKPCGPMYMKWLEVDAAILQQRAASGGVASKKGSTKAAVTESLEQAAFEADLKANLSYRQYGYSPPVVGTRWMNPASELMVTVTQSTVATYRKALDAIVSRRKQGKYHESRYNGLNLHSYWHRGTVEFRHHHGTTDPEKITNWGIFVGSIVDYCKNRDEADMANILALSPRESVGKLGMPNFVEAWLQTRWNKFTTGSAERRSIEPSPVGKTGEV